MVFPDASVPVRWQVSEHDYGTIVACRGCRSVEDAYDYQSFINSQTGNSHGKVYLDLPPQANTGSSRRYPKILALAIFLYLALTASPPILTIFSNVSEPTHHDAADDRLAH
uniref:Uncharacterized protein n=1 Tax=Fusarium oxysporum (strain Fo5176) TaxID=660025 RepID=A0A0D2YH27_FUSOF